MKLSCNLEKGELEDEKDSCNDFGDFHAAFSGSCGHLRSVCQRHRRHLGFSVQGNGKGTEGIPARIFLQLQQKCWSSVSLIFANWQSLSKATVSLTASLSRRSTDAHNVTGGGCSSGRVAITHGALLLSTSTRAVHLGDVLEK